MLSYVWFIWALVISLVVSAVLTLGIYLALMRSKKFRGWIIDMTMEMTVEIARQSEQLVKKLMEMDD